MRVRVTERRVDGGRAAHRVREDRLATEEPLEVRLAWPGAHARRVAVTMRTPGHDFELAAGLLFGEGLLSPGLVARVEYCTDAALTPEQEFNVVTVVLREQPSREPQARPDTVTAQASACGVCGAQSIAEVQQLRDRAREAARPEEVAVPAEVLHALPEVLREAQRVFDSTGALHAAGLFSADGVLRVAREDVGRHNAVDKAVGHRLLAGHPPGDAVLCVSGRVGFEIAQKAVAAGVGVLAAIGAPSSLAVRLARESGLGLVGFLSPERFVIYAGDDRIGV